MQDVSGITVPLCRVGEVGLLQMGSLFLQGQQLLLHTAYGSCGALGLDGQGLPDLADQPSVTNDLKTNLASASGMITEPAEYDTVSGLENTTRTAIQAMWAGESVDTTIATIMEAKLLGE